MELGCTAFRNARKSGSVVRLAAASLAFALLFILLGLTGCRSEEPVQPSSGETASEAGKRLFEAARTKAMAGTEHPDILAEATTGPAQPLLADYGWPDQTLAAWIMSDDAESAVSGMFQAMRPAKLSTRAYRVPVVFHGRSVKDFELFLTDDGQWVADNLDLTDPDAGGRIPEVEEGVAKLRGSLGAATEVRTALFLPSGLVFAVGKNAEREAAVYLAFADHGGPGVVGFNKDLPLTGTLYTPMQVARLLDPTTEGTESRADVELSARALEMPSPTEGVVRVGWGRAER